MVYQAAYTIADPKAQINALIDDVVRSSLPTMTLDHAYEAKEHIVERILTLACPRCHQVG